MPVDALRILADENIPWVREAFGALGPVRLLAGQQITAEAVREADVLLVRSVTPVGVALIAGSPLRFVGSATIGTDHVDVAYLQEQGIPFVHAPGSNADSVVEYVLAALLQLAVTKQESLQGKTVGIVGCGNIGGRLAERLPHLGVRVLLNDPPLAAQSAEGHAFISLDDLLAEADVVTVHVPLVREGPYPTHHLFDKEKLQRMKSDAWLLNTSRGAVVSNAALKRVLASNALSAVALDVWEEEPTPDPDLLRMVDLATPHIAGYSYDGKVQGTVILYEALTRLLHLPRTWDAEAVFAPGPEDHLTLIPPDAALSQTAWLATLVQSIYDMAADDRRMRELLYLPSKSHAAYFSNLRKHYPRRRAFHRHRLPRQVVPEAYQDAVERGLRVTLDD